MFYKDSKGGSYKSDGEAQKPKDVDENGIYWGLWKDGEVKSGMVELMKFPLIARLVTCVERCTRIWFVRSSGCCCRFL